MSNLTLLIPAKYEGDSLPVFLKELEIYDFKKIVILDQNDFETIDAVKLFNNVEILYQKNKGYGNALIEGINQTKTEYFSIINADGSMNPNELNNMLSLITEENNDLVFGSRYMKNSGSEDDDFVTTVGNFIFSLIGKVFFNLKISDILYTYVIGRTELVKNLKLSSPDFKLCIELPIKAHRSKYRYTSYPCYERKRIAGKKKVSPFLDGFRILMGMVILFFKR
jgi:glycosyltransferase involved in cell wall biosynthesis